MTLERVLWLDGFEFDLPCKSQWVHVDTKTVGEKRRRIEILHNYQVILLQLIEVTYHNPVLLCSGGRRQASPECDSSEGCSHR